MHWGAPTRRSRASGRPTASPSTPATTTSSRDGARPRTSSRSSPIGSTATAGPRDVHPRISLSAISTFDWSLDDDLTFWTEAAITNVGVSALKLERAGWEVGAGRVADTGLRVTNLIGLGSFRLDHPEGWTAQRDRVHHVLESASTVGAECVVLTTGPAGALTWEEAADALADALAPVLADARERQIPFALEHTNSLRVDIGFVHTLRDVVDVAPRLGTGVCMEINACWAERGLAGTIAAGVDSYRLVQVS